VDTPQTGVGVRQVEVAERVGVVAGRHDVRQLGRQQGGGAQRAVPVAHDRGEDVHGPVVGVLVRDALDGDRDVAVLPGVVTDADLGADERRLLPGLAAERLARGRELGKVLLGELDELVVVDRAGAGKDHLVGVQVLCPVLEEVVPVDGLDVLVGAEDVVTEGLACKRWRQGGRASAVDSSLAGSNDPSCIDCKALTLEGDGVELVEDGLLLVLADLLSLAEDRRALGLDRRRLKLGVREHVADDLGHLGHAVGERAAGVRRDLARGVGVEPAADVLDLGLELLERARRGAWTSDRARQWTWIAEMLASKRRVREDAPLKYYCFDQSGGLGMSDQGPSQDGTNGRAGRGRTRCSAKWATPALWSWREPTSK
jgi:hypothetical protein